MADEDALIGGNVRRFREARGMSQAALAAEMTSSGVEGFYPQTITKIENGTRSLKLAEGLALASVLRVQPGELQRPPATAVGDLKARTAITRLERAHGDAADAFQQLRSRRDDLEDLLKEKQLSDGVRREMKTVLREYTATAALLEGREALTDGQIEDAGEQYLDSLERQRRRQ